MKRRAFSLVEVAVASALAGIISASAVAAFALINQQLVRLQRESFASDHAKSLVDLLVTDLQGIGGGPIRPWMALWVENGASVDDTGRNLIFAPPPTAPDRVTFATLINEAPTCSIVAVAPGVVTSTGVKSTCCLGRLVDVAAIPGANKAAMAYLIRGDQHRQVVLTSFDTTACTASFAAGPLAAIDRPGTGGDVAFVDGTVAAASVKTLYLGENRELRLFVEKKAFSGVDVTLDAGETSRVAGDIIDFQVQVGYDRQSDGRLSDTSSAGDEWLFNAGGDNPSAFRPEDMRMVGVGVVVAMPMNDPAYTSTARIVGGQALTGDRLHLRGAMGRAALRNIFVFF